MNKLGHCLSCSLTCDIETGLPQSAQLQAAQSSILPVKPSIKSETVITDFWLDNFDINAESATGEGAIKTKHVSKTLLNRK